MTIDRQNILSLIGKDSKKYHSCILTCFTFDFLFFEERMMPVLRAANIKNVIVLLDASYYAKAMNETTGKEYRSNKTYSLIPVEEKGVFHSKMMLLAGKRQGLLVLGSGNLTASGIGTNDEIWGAFHLDNSESPNAPLFGQVWDYLQPYLAKAKGIQGLQLEWIHQYSPWLQSLDGKNGEFFGINGNQQLKLLTKKNQESIYYQLLRDLPNTTPEKLTIIAPYYDENGETLKNLLSDLSPNHFECVIDTEFGLSPIGLESALKNKIRFFPWKDCIKEFDFRYNRLHAKILHFQYPNGLEYLLLGSANPTIPGLGEKSKLGKNSETGIIIKRTNTQSYLSELGISIPKDKHIDISTLKRNATVQDNTTKSPMKGLILHHVEVSGNILSVHLKDSLSQMIKVSLLDRSADEIGVYEIAETGKKEYNLSITTNENLFKVCLKNTTGEIISDYALVHDSVLIAKCNPDAHQEALQQLLEKEYPDDEGISVLLESTDYMWADEQDAMSAKPSAGYANTGVQKSVGDEDYITLAEKEFNTVSREIEWKQKGILHNPSVQIAEFLSIYGRGLDGRQQEKFEDSMEQTLLEEKEEQGQGDVATKVIVRIKGEVELKAIKKYFNRLRDQYDNVLKSLYEKNALSESPKQPLTLKNLANPLIALQILQLFYGKTFETEEAQFVILLKHFRKERKLEVMSKKKLGGKEALGKLEKDFKLRRLEKVDHYNIHKIYYGVVPEKFDSLQMAVREYEEMEVIDDLNSVQITKHAFFQAGGINDGYFSIKTFLIKLLGKFLLLATAGIKKYDYDVLNQRQKFNCQEIFVRSLFISLNLKWRDEEGAHRDLLLLNLLYYFNHNELNEDFIVSLKKQLQQLQDKSRSISSHLESNKTYFFDALIIRYYNWLKTFLGKEKSSLIKPTNELSSGSIIFNSKLGFNLLLKHNNGKVTLIRPGYEWDDKYANYVLKNINYPPRSIAFEYEA